MVKIVVPDNCGNAPKSLLLRDFNVAIAKGDYQAMGQFLADDVIWNLFEPAGQKKLCSRKELLQEFRENLAIRSSEFTIQNILTHGNTAAVNGVITSSDGKKFVFCDVYQFASQAKKTVIQEMTSYIIEKESP